MKRSPTAFFSFLALSFVVLAPARSQIPPPQVLPAVTLIANGHNISAEVADSPDKREVGLMNRFSLRPDSGMLFVFQKAEPLSFWMKNTYIPLSIAFMDSSGRILNIENMAPQTETPHWSNGAALYALEMRKGWFVDNGVAVGDHIEGVDRAAKSRK